MEAAMEAFRVLSKDYSRAVNSRSTLESQLRENEFVKKVPAETDATVFKMVGPVLVKQDVKEAAANVNKRIEYITAEITRVEGQIKSLEEKQEEKRAEITKMQQVSARKAVAS
ncbi:Prefoldin subunit 6 [Irineochytrium annulatum]|nr:Prefoldin subunit 6 [Irineochytrium annulatum]